MQKSGKTTGLCAWLGSTIGRKQVIGATGVGLSLFVFLHMTANLLVLVSPQLYNEQSHALVSNPLIYFAEAGLIAIFLAHLAIALAFTVTNWRARDSRYAMAANGAKGTSAVQKSMWAQGLLILVFTILHLITFKFGPHYVVNYGKGEIRDLHRLVLEVFQQPIAVSWYALALVVLGFHLSHGVSSSFQTLGAHHPRYQPAIKCFGLLYAVVVTAGFFAPLLYSFFYRG